jgi:hypothetical protein
MGPLFIPQDIFELCFIFSEIFEFESCSTVSDTPQNKKFKLGGSLSLGRMCLGKCHLYRQKILNKSSFKGNGKLSKVSSDSMGTSSANGV